MSVAAVPRARLLPGDVFRVGSVGLRTRRLRAALSALGIAIGIASMVAVLGISESSKADLVARLDRLGTNLLAVQAGQGLFGGDSSLPEEAAGRISRIGPVEEVAQVGSVSARVYRNEYIPEGESGGISVAWTTPNLLETVAGNLADGRFFTTVGEAYPVVVLGADAAAALGNEDVGGGRLIQLGGHQFVVIGILEPLELASGLDRSVLIGQPVAETLFDADTAAGTIYVRTDPDSIEAVQNVLANTANPESPEEVETSQPSDALEARAAVNDAYTALFLGLGAVALLVGGVGIANVMVISVLERRSEIGLRRALGATRRTIWGQFLTESLILAVLGGAAGVVAGAAVTAVYASTQGWDSVVPAYGLVGGIAAALLIGAIAGFYPAARAARLSPTDALRSA